MSKLRLSITASLDGSAVIEERQANVGATIMGPTGLVDEIDLSVVPLILGSGARLFEGLDGGTSKLVQVRAVDAPGVAHIKYGVS